LSRQIVFLIPAMAIFGSIFGVTGILYAGPFADGLAFIISSTLIIIEVKSLGKKNEKSQTLEDDTSTDNILNQKTIITVSREYGSGGRYVARLVADKLGIKFYDKEFVELLSEETGLSEEYIEENEQKRTNLSNLDGATYNGLTNNDELFVKETELIKELSDKESCVIVGRCADFILRDNENTTKIFIYSNEEDKLKRVTEIYGLDEEKAKKEIKRIDKLRANHYKYYTDKNWKDYTNYDLCINSDTYGVEKTAEIICDTLKSKIKV
jgi:cytidylate kinase